MSAAKGYPPEIKRAVVAHSRRYGIAPVARDTGIHRERIAKWLAAVRGQGE